MTKIAVFGAGTWGIALARLLAANGRDVTVWSAIPAELKSLSTTRRHPNLPGMELPAAMHYTADRRGLHGPRYSALCGAVSFCACHRQKGRPAHPGGPDHRRCRQRR